MTLDSRLLHLLVCPVCKGPLQAIHDETGRTVELACAADRQAYPIRDGIALMLETEARSLVAAAGAAVTEPPPPEGAASRARP